MRLNSLLKNVHNDVIVIFVQNFYADKDVLNASYFFFWFLQMIEKGILIQKRRYYDDLWHVL